MTNGKTTNIGALLFIICLGSAIVPFMGSALNLALPYINRDLSLDAVVSGWVPAAFLLSTAILQIPSARIADMIGRRKVFIAGVVVTAIFTFMSALATSGATLIIYRFLTGVGCALMFGTSTAILTSSVPAEKRGMALGINTSVIYFSTAVGPFLGGIITQYLRWNTVFYITALLCVLVLVGSFLFIKDDWKEEEKSKFDLVGSILFAIGLSSLIYGFTQLPEMIGIVCVLVGCLFLLIFGTLSGFQCSAFSTE